MLTRRPDDCAAEDWLAFLGHRWNALLIWHLAAGPKRFSELQHLLPGISPKVLTERLAGLTRRGIALREMTQTFPRSVTYQLSAQGTELSAILRHLYHWARRDSESDIGSAPSRGA